MKWKWIYLEVRRLPNVSTPKQEYLQQSVCRALQISCSFSKCNMQPHRQNHRRLPHAHAERHPHTHARTLNIRFARRIHLQLGRKDTHTHCIHSHMYLWLQLAFEPRVERVAYNYFSMLHLQWFSVNSIPKEMPWIMCYRKWNKVHVKLTTNTHWP